MCVSNAYSQKSPVCTFNTKIAAKPRKPSRKRNSFFCIVEETYYDAHA